jgi:hypothetical protein
MSEKLEGFLRDGVRKYPEAVHAVMAFEREMSRRIDRAVLERDWAPLKKMDVKDAFPWDDDEGGGFGIAKWVGGYYGRVYVDLDFGVWWEAPEQPGPIVYADFYEHPAKLLGFPYPHVSPDGSHRSFLRWDRRFLAVDFPEDHDLGPPLKKLLDLLMVQVSKLKDTRS